MNRLLLVIFSTIPIFCFSKKIEIENIKHILKDSSQINNINAYTECNLLTIDPYYSIINGYDTAQLKRVKDSLYSVIKWDGNSYWAYEYSISNKFDEFYKKRNIRLLLSALKESNRIIDSIMSIIDNDSTIDNKGEYYGLINEFYTSTIMYTAKYYLAIGYNKEAAKYFRTAFTHMLKYGLYNYSFDFVSNSYYTLQNEFEDYYNELEDKHEITPILDSFYTRYLYEINNINPEIDYYKNLLPFFHPSTQTYFENKYDMRFESYFDALLEQLKLEHRLPSESEIIFLSKCYNYFASINDLLFGYSSVLDTYEKIKTKLSSIYPIDNLNSLMDKIANVYEFPDNKLHLLYYDDFAYKYLFQKEIISLRYHNTIEIQRAQYFKEYFKDKKTDINSYLLNRSITDFDKVDYIITSQINTHKDLDTFSGTIESYNISEFDYRNILINDTIEKLYLKHFQTHAFKENIFKGETFMSYNRIKKEYEIKGVYDFNKNKKDINPYQYYMLTEIIKYTVDSIYGESKYINYSRLRRHMEYIAIDLFNKWYNKTNKNTDMYLNILRKNKKFKALSVKLKNNSIPEIPYFTEDTRFNKKKYYIRNRVYKLIKNSNNIYTFNDDIGVAINKKTGNHLMFDFEIHKISSLTDFFWNQYRNSNSTQTQIEKDTAKREVLLVYNPSYSMTITDSNIYSENKTRNSQEDLIYYLKDSNTNSIFFKQLPATNDEGIKIKTILEKNNMKVNSYSGDSATEDKFYRIKSPYIIHLATHTYRFNTDTLDAAVYFNNCIVFANANNTINEHGFDPYSVKNDALLTGFEIINQSLYNTELVVLSACETAIGTDNNIFNFDYQNSLQRAFRLAGAKAVLASKWKVPDKQTQELIVEFYTNWLEKGMTKHKALQQAQLTLSKKYPEPYYWAAWVLYGE